MEEKELKDFEVLINIFFPFAEELLRKYGEFHPFAGALNNEGQVVSVGNIEEKEAPARTNQVEHLKNMLIAGKENLLVGTVFYDVTTRDQETGITSDAIAIYIEHKNGNAAYEFIYPYHLPGNEEISFEESYGNERAKEIF
jgi:hypothetical protein